MVYGFIHNNIKVQNPTLKVLESVDSGVDNLDPNLTINGITVAPMVRYKGGDAAITNWPSWDYGDELVFTSGAQTPTYNFGSPLLGDNDDSVLFNSGSYFKAAASSTGDITTEDFVVEFVIWPTTATAYVVDKDSGAVVAYRFRTATSLLYANIPSAPNILAAVVDRAWNHVIFFFDRSGFAVSYVNGVAQGAVDISSATGSLSTSNRLTVGANCTTGALPCTTALAYFAMWKHEGWMDTHLQAAVAQERFANLTASPSAAPWAGDPTTHPNGQVVWGCQPERNARVLPSTYIPNVTTTQTRNTDVLLFKGDDGNLGGTGSEKEGTLQVQATLPSQNLTGSSPCIITLADDAAASDKIQILSSIINGNPKIYSISTEDGVNVDEQDTSADISDGIAYTHRLKYQADEYKYYLNGSASMKDTLALNPPNDLDQIKIRLGRITQETKGLMACCQKLKYGKDLLSNIYREETINVLSLVDRK
jgi:hypothetical protein